MQLKSKTTHIFIGKQLKTVTEQIKCAEANWEPKEDRLQIRTTPLSNNR